MLGRFLAEEIKERILAGDFTNIRGALEDWQAADLADLMADLPPEDEGVLFRLLPRAAAAETFEHLPFEAQERLLKALGQEQVAEILNTMAPDDRTALLEELPGEVTQRLLTLLSPGELRTAKQLLGYPEDSIGRLMTPDYTAIREDWTVSRVLEHIRRNGRESETLDVLYVTDDRGKLVDDIAVREILLAEPETRVSELMDGNLLSLAATADQETAVEMFRKYDVLVLPVTDSRGLLLGIVTIDDVLDVAEEEATRDIQAIGAVEFLEEPYMQVSLKTMVRKRAVWLVILFVGGMFTMEALGQFESQLAAAPGLMLLLPLVIASGGNSGSQAATLVIRALALGEVRLRDWWLVVRREIFSGLALGSLLGTIGFLLVAIRHTLFGEHWQLIGVTIFVALIGVVMFGTIVGSTLPLILKRLGADPATSSTPFIATLVDVTGIVIYLTVSIVVLRGVLL
jgi:magnesium transporter